jgi:hypothetical protein
MIQIDERQDDADRDRLPQRAAAEGARRRREEQAGGDREAGHLEQQHLGGKAADDPQDRADLLDALALGEITAPRFEEPSRWPGRRTPPR